LVVDDDPVIRDMMVDILECEGYATALARNGQEALRVLQAPESYLVFLDFLMPGFSGKEVCASLLAQPQTRQRHIIVLMSAMDMIDEAAGLDVDMVMPKPFVVDDVEEVLHTYMR
jgi:two-component system, OmpR family, alkaline phosphatase synthesis response regulator PhoP